MSKSSLMNFLKQTKSFEQCFKQINILCLADGKCTAELEVSEGHTNPLGSLHGGLSATLVDCISTYGLHSHEKAKDMKSVSVNMNLSYIGAAKEGEHILIETDTVKVGKTLAFCEVLIKNKANGNILVKGEHTKFLLK